MLKRQLTLLFALSTCLPAQEAEAPAAPAKPANPHAERLRAACSKTLATQELRFETRHRTTRKYDLRARKVQAVDSADHKTTGLLKDKLLHVDFGDQKHILVGPRRMLSKDSTRDWTLRHNCLAGGGTLPFFLDPELLLTLVAAQADQVKHRGAGQLGNLPVEYFGLQIDGQAAHELAFGGAIPTPAQSSIKRKQAGRNAAVAFQALNLVAGVRGGGQKLPAMRLDIVLAIDPTTRRILRILGRRVANRLGPQMAGNVFFAGNGLNQNQEEEEAKPKPPRPGSIEHALPKLSETDLEKKECIRFDYRFFTESTLALPELSPMQRKLLGL